MLPTQRLQSLQTKKAMIDKSILEAEKSPSTDATILRQMKKQKLEIKETIAGVRADNGHH